MLFFPVVQDKVNTFNMSQLLAGPLSIATDSHHQSLRISAMCQSEQATALAVGNMGNGAGIEYIDISPISRRYQPISRLGKLLG